MRICYQGPDARMPLAIAPALSLRMRLPLHAKGNTHMEGGRLLVWDLFICATYDDG